MEPEQMQEELSPEEAKASLGLATRLGEGMLMMEAPQMAENGEEGTETGQTEEMPEEETPDIKEELESMREELKAMIEEEVGGIREDIKEALQTTDEEE